MSSNTSSTPQGFSAFITNLGIRDTTEDFVLDISEKECRDVAVLRLYKGSG